MINKLILSPENIPVLSKQNAATFHRQVKERIFETGTGLFEYVEAVKFFAALDKQISGDSNRKIEPDKEFIDYIREQIRLNGEKETITTKRGVKFQNAETGSSYDFSQCGDPELIELEAKAKDAADALKVRKEFLKALPMSGMDIITADGEAVKVYPRQKVQNLHLK